MAQLNSIICTSNARVTGNIYGGNVYADGKVVTRLTATPTSGQIVIADGTAGGVKTSGYTIATSVPSGAVFTDKYHTTGSWSGLTYTATANGGAGALAFTVPTGTTATTVSVGNHTHGNIQSGGTLQTTDVTIASGDKLVITDSSDSNKVARASLSFGTATTTYLRNDGTWATPTDTNNAVTQTATNTNANYEVLFSATADNTTRTEGARKYSNLIFNPSTGTLTTTIGSFNTTNIDTGNITELNAGNLICTGAARFTNKINGVCTDGTTGTTKYMRQDGTWQVPPNETYTIDTNGNNIRLKNSVGTVISTITAPYATSAGSAAPTSHTHGNIQNGGTLQTSDITIADGDKLVVTDLSDSSKIARTSISFDGATTTKCLTQKGTWETFTPGSTSASAEYTALSGGPKIGSITINSSTTNFYAPDYRLDFESPTTQDNICLYSGNTKLSQITPFFATESSKLRTNAGSEDVPIYFSNGIPTITSIIIYSRSISGSASHLLKYCQRVFILAFRQSATNTCLCCVCDQWHGITYISKNDALATIAWESGADGDGYRITNKISSAINLLYFGWKA